MEKKIDLKGKLRFYLSFPLIVTVIFLFMTIWGFTIYQPFGMGMLIFLVLYTGIALIHYFYVKKNIISEMTKFSVRYMGVQNQLLNELTNPYVIVLEDGRIVWSNDEFRKTLGKSNKVTSIHKLIPELTVESFPRETNQEVKVNIQHKKHDYHVSMLKIPVEGFTGLEDNIKVAMDKEVLVAIHLKDVTEVQAYIRKDEKRRLVTGLIYFDNYEEVMEGIEEERQSLALAMIDRRINKYISDVDGLVRKLEKDKYFIIIGNTEYEKLESDKFSLLKDIKTINVGNSQVATLSIGIGLHGETYTKCYNEARIAIGLALARGGDQAVIKDGQNIKYFGGHKEQTARNTRVRARVKAEALKELILEKESIMVMGHKMPDADSFGACMGIYRCGKTLDRKVRIVIDENPVNVLPLYNEVAESKEYEDIFVSPKEALELIDDDTLLVVVDVNRPKHIECQEVLEKAKTIVVMDHHRKGKESIENAVLSYIEPYASSTCELVAEILQYIAGDIRIPVLEANCLYAGIIIDTRNFVNRTGVRTFEAAAFLRRNGADINQVRKMFRDDFDSYRAKAKAIQLAELFKDQYAIARCSSDGNNPIVLTAQTANDLLDISEIKGSFAFTVHDGKVFMSARSIDEINVQLIAEEIGGGGHINAAGAQLEHGDIEKAVDKLKGIISRMIDEGEL